MRQYVEKLKERAEQNLNGQTQVKVRTILRQCKTKRRTEAFVTRWHEMMEVYGLHYVNPDETIATVSLEKAIHFQVEKKEQMHTLEAKRATQITVQSGFTPQRPYPHQEEALRHLDRLYERKRHFSSLLVLPTGGGKTATAARFLAKRSIAEGKKVLWLAHRHELLDQAHLAFLNVSYEELIPERETYHCRVISGVHERARAIEMTDDVIIASKDSLYRQEAVLQQWLANDEELFVIIDEAHHAPARTYRELLESLEAVVSVTLLGLTATPFRTAEEEVGSMRAIFHDDIVYKIDLTQLITKGILAEPHLIDVETNYIVETDWKERDIHQIQALDKLPQHVSRQLTDNHKRNELITQHYKEHEAEYGQTLVFAMNRVHAIALRETFRLSGIHAEAIISSVTDDTLRIDTSQEARHRHIEAFKRGEFPVLINVNMLTEGTDLPNVQTVFLTRPTTSKILMTQMLGRALRGERAGGTRHAYIVSFIDDWSNAIAWENPRHLLVGEDIQNGRDTRQERLVTELLSTKMIRSYVEQLSTNRDGWLKEIPFQKSIPLGLYLFELLIPTEEGEVTEHREIIIFESTAESYAKLMQGLPKLVSRDLREERLSDERLTTLTREAERLYFQEASYIPAYETRDIRALIQYYAMTEQIPNFYAFEQREETNIERYVEHIMTHELSRREEVQWLKQQWEQNIFLQLYFGHRLELFVRAINDEIEKTLLK